MSELTYDRVNWKDSPDTDTPINATNLNKMDKGISDCVAKVNECFQSASNGKAAIASAITGKGITTASNATYETMASNITNGLMKIPTASKNITANGSNIDVLNYSKVTVSVGSSYKEGSFSITGSATSASVNCGFQPTHVIAVFVETGGRSTGWIKSGTGYRWTSTIGNNFGIGGEDTYPIYISVTSTGFTVSISHGNCRGIWYYLAVK